MNSAPSINLTIKIKGFDKLNKRACLPAGQEGAE
jgi:hypothetical protein